MLGSWRNGCSYYHVTGSESEPGKCQAQYLNQKTNSDIANLQFPSPSSRKPEPLLVGMIYYRAARLGGQATNQSPYLLSCPFGRGSSSIHADSEPPLPHPPFPESDNRLARLLRPGLVPHIQRPPLASPAATLCHVSRAALRGARDRCTTAMMANGKTPKRACHRAGPREMLQQRPGLRHATA